MPQDPTEKRLNNIFIPFEVSIPPALVRNVIVSIKQNLEDYLKREGDKSSFVSKDNYFVISADGTALNMKDKDGNIFPFCNFQTDRDGYGTGISLDNRNLNAVDACQYTSFPPSFSASIEKIRHEQLGEKVPTQKDFDDLYKEIYSMVEKEYKTAKAEGKDFALILCDKHRDTIIKGFLKDVTKEESHKLFGAVQIMALDAYKKITGEDGTKLFLEVRENVLKNLQGQYDRNVVDELNHMALVAGNGKKLGFNVISNETSQLNEFSMEEAKIRDKNNNLAFMNADAGFAAVIGSGHTPSVQGVPYEVIEQNTLNNKQPTLKADPAAGICSKTHHTMYLLAAKHTAISNFSADEIKGMGNYLDNNTSIPVTPEKWDMKNVSNMTTQQMTQAACINNSLTKMEKPEVEKYQTLLTLLQHGNPEIDADLMNITRILSKSGTQLKAPELKEELGKLAVDFIDNIKSLGFYEKNKTNVDLVAKKIREL